jgi:Tol biopolymer transport system component
VPDTAMTRAGQTIATFPNFTQPAWTPDGRLVIVGDEGLYNNGIYITDTSFLNVIRLDPTMNGSQMPAVSPDGKTILFVNANALWSMNIDGSNQRMLDNTAQISWPVFSRDGLYASVIIKDSSSQVSSCLAVIVTGGIIEGTEPSAFIVTDANGQNALTTCSRVAWR